MTIEPNKTFLDGVTPTIKWNGAEWPIPLLAPKQLRHVLPAVSRIRLALKGRPQAPADPEDKDAREAYLDAMSELAADRYEDMASIVFWGLKRAHPEMTREEFEEAPFGLNELQGAMMVVSNQTNTLTENKGGGSAAPVGEGQKNPSQ